MVTRRSQAPDWPVSRPCRIALLATIAWLSLAALAGCTRSPGTGEVRGNLSQTGIASWYGPGFHGKRTTSGAVYDQNQLTAAHQTLPLGSRVRVTNLDNRRVVEVLINDRGPFAKGRIIDLSYAAAERVAMVGPGTAPVLVEVIDAAGPTLTHIPDGLDYTLQVGAFSRRANAIELKKRLEHRYGDAVSIEEHRGYHRVQLGTFSSHAEARDSFEELVRAGFAPVIVEKQLRERVGERS